MFDVEEHILFHFPIPNPIHHLVVYSGNLHHCHKILRAVEHKEMLMNHGYFLKIVFKSKETLTWF